MTSTSTTSRRSGEQKRLALAPGARVEIRDEEWVVRSVKPATFGGHAVAVTGTSELVRDKHAIFLTELDQIRPLLPEETELVLDTSPQFRKSRLYLESLLRRSPATGDGIWIGQQAAIQKTNYQLEPAAKALRQLRPRILMADGVGLGKTIEVGILLSELIQRGRANRILVVALKSILSQFQEELWARFTIPLVRLDSVGIQRVQAKIPSNMNPFYHFDRVIISVDTLKKDAKYRRYLEESHWDVVVVDECQNVADRSATGRRGSQRSRLARLLAERSDGLILTSATPHDGRPESFASLMNLLEPTAVADPSNYGADDVRDYFLRRFKKDVVHEVSEAFHERELDPRRLAASPAEDTAFEVVQSLDFRTIARTRGAGGILFRTLLLKSLLSSPAACASTSRERLKRLESLDGPDVDWDRQQLEHLIQLCDAIGPKEFSKYRALLAQLQEIGLDKPNANERVVVFSERIPTLAFLEERLRKDLKLKAGAVAVFKGSLDDQSQQALVKGFGTESSPIRILLASDAASEGINLHFFCHRMVHFDLPWSLITLEQRNGRIDRFGQSKNPMITYLMTIPSNSELKGDLRVLDRLIEKEDAAHKNLGDVASLMSLYDAEKEGDRVARGIETGTDPEEVIPDEPESKDLLQILYGTGTKQPEIEIESPIRLFESEREYVRQALDEAVADVELEEVDHLDGLILRPPTDLLRRYDYLPLELRRDASLIKLTANRELVMEALEASRSDDKTWPEWQLLWEQHPVVGWLNDRVLAAFGRHEAPILRLARGLAPSESVFLMQGVFSNRDGQPVIIDWFGVSFRRGQPPTVRSLTEVISDTGLGVGMANPATTVSDHALAELNETRPVAVDNAKRHMESLRNERAATISAPLREGLRRLRDWRSQRSDMLEERRENYKERQGTIRADQGRRLHDEEQDVERTYEERRSWIERLQTEPEAYIRIAAVLISKDD